jgi:hypothetical protein
MSQCPKMITFGRRFSIYCQGERGHEGDHTPPPMTWASLVHFGTEGDDGRTFKPPRASRRSPRGRK